MWSNDLRLCGDLLAFDGPADAVSQCHLDKLLYEDVDVPPDATGEVSLHSMHEEGQSLDHPDHLHQGILLLSGVIVAGCLRERRSAG